MFLNHSQSIAFLAFGLFTLGVGLLIRFPRPIGWLPSNWLKVAIALALIPWMRTPAAWIPGGLVFAFEGAGGLLFDPFGSSLQFLGFFLLGPIFLILFTAGKFGWTPKWLEPRLQFQPKSDQGSAGRG